MPQRDNPAILAVSPDGRSIYNADGTVYTSGGGRSPQSALVEPNDGYEGLKFARFLDDDTLGVGFTTGYDFDGYGSAGSTQYVVQVFRRTQAASVLSRAPRGPRGASRTAPACGRVFGAARCPVARRRSRSLRRSRT